MSCSHREYRYSDGARLQLAAYRGVKDVSTRVEGTESPVILLAAKATRAAETARLMPAITGEDGNLRHCNLREWYLARGPSSRFISGRRAGDVADDEEGGVP